MQSRFLQYLFKNSYQMILISMVILFSVNALFSFVFYYENVLSAAFDNKLILLLLSLMIPVAIQFSRLSFGLLAARNATNGNLHLRNSGFAFSGFLALFECWEMWCFSGEYGNSFLGLTQAVVLLSLSLEIWLVMSLSKSIDNIQVDFKSMSDRGKKKHIQSVRNEIKEREGIVPDDKRISSELNISVYMVKKHS